ncbi:hypothetical protein J6590_048444, partial [Homalodisca vitripennis]
MTSSVAAVRDLCQTLKHATEYNLGFHEFVSEKVSRPPQVFLCQVTQVTYLYSSVPSITRGNLASDTARRDPARAAFTPRPSWP